MSAATVEDPQTVEALTAGLLGVDASRRVGWAKAFAALARVDALEEETRMWRDELKQLQRAYSRLVGLVTHMPKLCSPILDEELHAHTAAERSFRREDAWTQGRRIAEQHAAFLGGQDEEEVRRARAAKRADHRRHLFPLFEAARGAGHDCNGNPDGSWVCSCGASGGAAGNGKFNHVSEAVYGIKFNSLKRRWKREDEEVEES